MTTIYEYPMSTETSKISMPKGAQVLHVAMSGNVPMIWALVDEDAPMEERDFQTVGTGWPMTERVRKSPYIGTIMDSPFVWHIFEVKEEEQIEEWPGGRPCTQCVGQMGAHVPRCPIGAADQRLEDQNG